MIIDLKNGKNGTAPVVRLNSGHMLPVVGLGTYALHGDACVNAVYQAVQSGYRLIAVSYTHRRGLPAAGPAAGGPGRRRPAPGAPAPGDCPR